MLHLLNSSYICIQTKPLALIGLWIPYNGRATGVPPVTVCGLDHRTEDRSRSSTTQSWKHSLLNSPEQDNPNSCCNQLPHIAEYKGTSRQGKILSYLGMTDLTLLHLPCFSHSRLMRLEATITFIEHIT